MRHMPRLAPAGSIPEARRGRLLGRFCRECGGVYPAFRSRHVGKPMVGRDHIASPCVHEGATFGSGADWWESAVELLPVPEEPPLS